MRAETADDLMADDATLRATFARLLSEHGAGLARVARVYTRSPAEASDLAQDIAVAIWTSLPNFRAECSERTFVYRIAHNRGITHAEGRRARDRATPVVAEPPEVADSRPSLEEALDAARRREALFRALGELPVGTRAVLTLALEGLSHQEVAEVLGTTANSVAVRLSRARAELREKLTKTEEER